MRENAAEQLVNKLKATAIRTRKFVILTVIFCAMSVVLALLLFRPVVKVDLTQLRLLEEDRMALKAQTVALEALVEAQATTIMYLSDKDSEIIQKLNTNKLAIDKLKIYEVPINYANYGSDELTRAYADLER